MHAGQNGAWLALGASCLVGTRSVAFSAAGCEAHASAPVVMEMRGPPNYHDERAQVGRPMPWETTGDRHPRETVGDRAAHHPPTAKPGTRMQLAAAGTVATGKSADSRAVRWGGEEQGAPREVHLTPHTLHPSPYTPHPTPHTLRPAPHTPHPTTHTPRPTPDWRGRSATGECGGAGWGGAAAVYVPRKGGRKFHAKSYISREESRPGRGDAREGGGGRVAARRARNLFGSERGCGGGVGAGG